MGKNKIPETGIYDARQLGTGRMLLLGFQHMFAMFGATILVPILTASTSRTRFCSRASVRFCSTSSPAAKSRPSSVCPSPFGGYRNHRPHARRQPAQPLRCFTPASAWPAQVLCTSSWPLCSRPSGAKKVMRFFPPIVTGPIIIAIGLNLSSSAINNCTGNWWIAIAAILIIVAANIWGKGMIKIIPILLGVIGSYLLAVIFDADVRANLVANVSAAKWFALPIKMEQTVFGLFASGNVDTHMLLTAVITIVPLSLATMVEHIGDVSAISSTCNRNYIENPGLHRTLMGDGLATTLAALFGAPANTTYGENTGVLALSRIYDPRVIRIAAVLAMLFSFSPKFAAIISSMPSGTIGGVSLVLYGMISAVGVRNVVENKVDFTKSRNVLVAALILVLSIGISYSSAGSPSWRDQPLGSGRRLHRRHRPERHYARQGLCLRRRQAGRRIRQLHRPVNNTIKYRRSPVSGCGGSLFSLLLQNGAFADALRDLGKQDAVFHGSGKRVVVIRLKFFHRHVVCAADLAERLCDVLLVRVQILRLRDAADERLDAHGLLSAGPRVLAQLFKRGI